MDNGPRQKNFWLTNNQLLLLEDIFEACNEAYVESKGEKKGIALAQLHEDGLCRGFFIPFEYAERIVSICCEYAEELKRGSNDIV